MSSTAIISPKTSATFVVHHVLFYDSYSALVLGNSKSVDECNYEVVAVTKTSSDHTQLLAISIKIL